MIVRMMRFICHDAQRRASATPRHWCQVLNREVIAGFAECASLSCVVRFAFISFPSTSKINDDSDTKCSTNRVLCILVQNGPQVRLPLAGRGE